jgi:hypothetical protein
VVLGTVQGGFDSPEQVSLLNRTGCPTFYATRWRVEPLGRLTTIAIGPIACPALRLKRGEKLGADSAPSFSFCRRKQDSRGICGSDYLRNLCAPMTRVTMPPI